MTSKTMPEWKDLVFQKDMIQNFLGTLPQNCQEVYNAPSCLIRDYGSFGSSNFNKPYHFLKHQSKPDSLTKFILEFEIIKNLTLQHLRF